MLLVATPDVFNDLPSGLRVESGDSRDQLERIGRAHAWKGTMCTYVEHVHSGAWCSACKRIEGDCMSLCGQ